MCGKVALIAWVGSIIELRCARALIGDTAVTLPTTNMNAEQTSIAASERHAPFSFRLSRYTDGGPQYGPKR
jgi:hypothetical protein